MRYLEERRRMRYGLSSGVIVDELKEKHVTRRGGNRRRKEKWMDYVACIKQ